MGTKEPRVYAEDVRLIMEKYLNSRYHLQRGDAVEVMAERAGLSTRTVYRVLEGRRRWLELDQADRLLMAADASIQDVRIEEV